MNVARSPGHLSDVTSEISKASRPVYFSLIFKLLFIELFLSFFPINSQKALTTSAGFQTFWISRLKTNLQYRVAS